MITAKVRGIPDLKRELSSIPAKLRVRVLRNALAAGARLVQREARARTPVISPGALAVRKGYRKPGTVRDAISVRTSKAARARGDVGVFVNVRPAKGALIRGGNVLRKTQRGAKNPNDPFYWRWLEFGRTGRAGVGQRDRVARNKKAGIKGVRFRRALAAVGPMKAYAFLRAGATKLDEALAVFIARVGPAIQKLNRPKAPAP